MRRLNVGEAQFNVFECGAGPAVIFIHGFPLNHAMWTRQLDELAATNRLIAPDLRGFGHSAVSDGTVSMAQMADDLAGLLDVLNIRQSVCLCGLSMGGYVAFEFLRRHRDRVRSLILCDTRSVADTPEAPRGAGKWPIACWPKGLASWPRRCCRNCSGRARPVSNRSWPKRYAR